MNDTLEEAFRNVAADNMALGFIVENLLAQWLKGLPPAGRAQLAETLKRVGRQTDHFAKAAQGDDALAELFADVTVRMHEKLDGYVARALDRIE